MRTTVDLDPTVLERAKRLAQSEDRTLGSVLSDALAAYLAKRRQSAKDPPFDLIVRGTPGARFPTLAEIVKVEDEEETTALRIPGLMRHAPP
jgi:hypothetical protein